MEGPWRNGILKKGTQLLRIWGQWFAFESSATNSIWEVLPQGSKTHVDHVEAELYNGGMVESRCECLLDEGLELGHSCSPRDLDRNHIFRTVSFVALVS